jgi:peptidoglycan/LPS O-acetylase OafA/YrhL
MSAGTTPATSGRAEFAEPAGALPPRWRRRRRWVIVAVVLVLAAAGAVVALTGGSHGQGSSGGGSSSGGSTTSLAAVERRSLSKRIQVTGRLGYAGSYTVLASIHRPDSAGGFSLSSEFGS